MRAPFEPIKFTLLFAVITFMLLGSLLRAQVPFDFTDDFYIENGLDPENFDFRISPEDVNATWGTSPDAIHNNTRILEALGGHDSAGQLLYYPAPPANISDQAFLPNAAGQRARQIANQFRAFRDTPTVRCSRNGIPSWTSWRREMALILMERRSSNGFLKFSNSKLLGCWS